MPLRRLSYGVQLPKERTGVKGVAPQEENFKTPFICISLLQNSALSEIFQLKISFFSDPVLTEKLSRVTHDREILFLGQHTNRETFSRVQL